ncbi:uncharacterized protein LOC141525410 [Cotesia typhae]|uniref:uncharacterized protein LOC141525410 n=1 Tax=Cotesia typhae TaxID=2053667 RepID=UPI003D69D57A
MSETQSITITESINSFIEFIRKLKESISSFQYSFKFVYDVYISQFSKLNASGRKKNYGSYRKIRKLYEKIMKFLKNFMNDFSKEYSETLSLAVEINALAEEFSSFTNRFPKSVIDGMGPEELYQRSRRLSAITERHNKLAILYNGRIHRFNTLLDNLKSQTLVYEHSKKKKLMALSISDKLSEFTRLVDGSFTSMGLLSANVTSDFLKNYNNVVGSANLTPINLLNGDWTVDPQSWFPPSATDGATLESQNYDENLKMVKADEAIMQKAKLITKSKTLINFEKNVDAFDSHVKDAALKVFMDCQFISLPPQSSTWLELQEMLNQHPYLLPNLKLQNEPFGLITETQNLEEKAIACLKTSPNDLEVEKVSVKDVFDFTPSEANEVLLYYEHKGFVLWLQYYFLIYKRGRWIQDMLKRNLSDEFLRHYKNYFKWAHGFTEAIAMEKFVAENINQRMVGQIRKLFNYVDDKVADDDAKSEIRKKLCESFEKISFEEYLLFLDKIEAAEFKQAGKKIEIMNRITNRQKELKLFNDEHEKLLEQYRS